MFQMLFEHISPQVASCSSVSFFVSCVSALRHAVEASFSVKSRSQLPQPDSDSDSATVSPLLSLLRRYLSHCTKLLNFGYFSMLPTCDEKFGFSAYFVDAIASVCAYFVVTEVQ